MESAWTRAKRALAHRLCIAIPGPREEVAERSISVANFVESASDSVPDSSAASVSLSASGSRSSKGICAICLVTMRTGQGHALFTAQCSHTFHFHCISSNVRHGNIICPVCRAKWTEIPSHIQPPEPHLSRSRVNPVNTTQDVSSTTTSYPFGFLPRVVRMATPTRRQFHPPEPAIFNDDERVVTPSIPETSTNNNNVLTPNLERVKVKMFPEYSAIPHATSKENFGILIHLTAPHSSSIRQIEDTSIRATVDLVTVLDVSGSMAGTKLALLKRAMGFVIQNLGPNDRLSVVAFSSNARRLFPLTLMSSNGKLHALQAVNSLSASGGTNIAEGLRKAAKVIDERSHKNSICSIILLSDGQDTYTVAANRIRNPDYRALVPPSILRSTTGGRTPVHTFGFGTDHDSAAMHAIAEISRGTFSFIEADVVIQDAFAQCIGGLMSVVVQGMSLCIRCMEPGAVITSIHSGSYENDLCDNARTGTIEVGDLYADEERDFLVSITVPSLEGQRVTKYQNPLIKASYAYKDPMTSEIITLQDEGIELTIDRPEHIETMPVMSREVDRERNRVQATEAMSVARQAAERGALSDAVSVLEERRRLLSESLAARNGDRLCLALDAEMREMQERMASRERYEEMGRAYMLSGLSSHWSQRATARGDSTENHSMVHSYQTPSMIDMLQRSQTFLPAVRSPVQVPISAVRPSRSMGRRTQPS